jgi:glycosyltransferase involved in cell wall biosynthesis
MNKLVSIIIPCYNAEKYIEQCINSVINQTYKNIELIVINDGSKDNSGKIIQTFAKQYNWIKYFEKENGGVSSARNLGLDFVNGDYVTFIDADDWIENNHIENLVRNLESANYDLSICSFKLEKRNNKSFKQPNKVITKIMDTEETMKNVFVGKLFPGGYLWNKLFKREKIGNLRFDKIIYYGEDLLFVYNYLKNCSKTIYQSNRTYHYIKTPNSIVRSKFNFKKLTVLTCLEIIMEDLKSYNPSIINFAEGLYCLLNLEILYYLIRDKVKDKALKSKIKKQFKNSMKSLRKTKLFHRYRRYLVPVAYALLKAL